MIILGIDPGTHKCGYGILDSNKNSIIQSGVIHTGDCGLYERLNQIYHKLKDIIEDAADLCLHDASYDAVIIDIIAMEDGYVRENYAMAAKRLGEARGVIFTVGFEFNLPIIEYAPDAWKKTIARGNASKEEVLRNVNALFKLEITELDESDAVGIAYCHACKIRQNEMLNPNKKTQEPKHLKHIRG